MGRIILNGQQYGGGGGGGSADIVEVTLAEYIALGDEVNTDGKLYCITDLNNSDVQGYPPMICSTDEREIGVWIDGKPLYQKTTDLGSVSANASVDITVGIGAGVVETVVNISVIGNYSTTFWQSLPFPLPSNVSSYSAYIDGYKTHNDKIEIKTGSDRDFTKLLCTIQYTKTSDTAGSGIWNGQGGYAHHYSTSEKVIGTWIDGKPIYQRVITGLSIGQSSGTSYYIPIPSPDLEQIIDSTLMSTLTQYKTMTHPPTWISNSSNLAIRSQESDTYDTFIITYTKTTD